MFTGLIQALAPVRSADARRLHIDNFADDIELGESIACNGVCLTVVDFSDGLVFDLSEETWRRTALHRLKPGDPVNVERAMRASDRFGGHIVSGHVDSVGRLVSIEEADGSWIYRFAAGAAHADLLVDKGSVAVEGISLTVVSPNASGDFEVWIIPHTRAHTNLGMLEPGDAVNLEFDVVAKYVRQMVAPYRA